MFLISLVREFLDSFFLCRQNIAKGQKKEKMTCYIKGHYITAHDVSYWLKKL